MHNAFYLRKTAIFFKIAPMAPFTLWKSANNAFWKSKTVVQKIFHGTWWGHLVGAHGGGTWSGHLRPAWVPPAPAGCPPVYPPHKPGTHHTHSLTQSYIHTERHHKNPKDKSFGKKKPVSQKRAGGKEWIEILKFWIQFFTNFRNFTDFSSKFCKISGIFNEFRHFGTCSRNPDKISSKFRWEIAFFMKKSEISIEISIFNLAKLWLIFCEILRSERCKGMLIL